ncbi:hypothetical protein FRC00_012123 [Tulasnella sp. 408]|nr:hypothetical protein FRC00_012123 [Tulasnella sp. 408]
MTMESTQHQEGGDAVKDESFVVDSEIERLSRANNASVPEAEGLRMPGKPEVGIETPIPTRLVDAADGIPAKDLLVPDSQHNGSALQLSDDEDPLGERVTRPGYMIGDDGTRHPMARCASANPPEMMEHPYQISGPKVFRDSSFASLLEHDAQPRNEETLEFPNDEFDYGEYIHDMGSAICSPGTRSLIERIEKQEEFEARNDQEVHLMASRGGKHRKHRHHRRKDDTAGAAYSSYDVKGKAREPGTRPAETEQIRLDKEFAESEQARIYEEDSKAATNNADIVVEKDRSKAKKKDKKRKSKAKNHHRKRKSSGHRMSRYTKRKLENKEAKLKAWRERSDISEHADDGGREPPDDSSSSSSSSSDPSSDDDTSTSSESESSEEPDSTSSSSNESNEIHHKSRQRRNKKSKQEGKRRNALAKTIKYPEPAAYDGRAHLETFETFMFEFNSWVEVNDIPEKYQMMAMKRFLTGKAGNHYMTFAAIDLKRWTVDNYLRALFNHCFPIHFRSEMRAKFNRCVQGSRTTREFLRELRTLGNRLPDIGDVQIRLQYWEGSNQYLRVEWAKSGMDPESTTLAELEVAAERFEMAETLKKGEDRRTSKPSRLSSAVEKSEKRADKKKERPRRWQNKPGQKIRWKKSARETGTSETSPPEKRYAKREKSGDVQEGKGKLSKARKDELRASNKCFHCEQVGHLAVNCPVKKTIRPSVGAISLPSIETLHSSVNSISLFAMSAPTRVVAKRRRPSRQTDSSPFGNPSPSSVVVSPPSDSSRSDLISNPAEMLGQPTAAHAAVRFGWELGKKLNQAPTGPESKLIAPEPGQETNRRYTVYVRRNGRSLHVLDSYAKR